MRIAVPTDDGATVARHFGRSAAFLVFETENGRARPPAATPNRPHEACAGGRGEAGHGHAGILALLAGCRAVLCGGMGRRAADALTAAGIEIVMVEPGGDAAETVAGWLSGALRPPESGFCRCR